MRRCHQCGKILREIPYTCRRCGNTFCSDHHLPENHRCSGHHHRESKSHPRFCGNCGREMHGLSFRCTRCKRILCDDCRLPENHGCTGVPPRKPNRKKRTFKKSMIFLISLIGLIILILLIINGGYLSRISDSLNLISQLNSNDKTVLTNTTSTDNSRSMPYLTALPSATLTQVVTTPNLETGMTQQSFKYTLQGKPGTIDIKLYYGVYDKILSQPSFFECTRYMGDSSPCTTEEIRQSNLKFINDSTSKKYLDELVSSIKMKTSNTDDQARIAINLVQQIPYDTSRLYSKSTATRSPYEVLYDNKGDCDEKSRLLAYLLRGLGYGVVLFDFSSESHMAVGIKSPLEYSYKNSGYAFIESTQPSIPTDALGDYVGTGKLTSTPKIIQISEGNLFSSVSEEYYDAALFNQFGDDTTLAPKKYREWEILMWKYGMTTKDGTTITEDPNNKPLCKNEGILCNDNCYEKCDANMIGKCTTTGVICEYIPGYCPAGLISCNNKCWTKCPSSNSQCTSEGLVCYM